MSIQSYKQMIFPKEDIETLKKQDRIITTRVSRQFTKFNRGDKVIVPWGDKFKIVSIKKFKNIKEHPYYKYLTRDQIELISKYPNLAVLTLEKINEAWTSKTPRAELPDSIFGLKDDRKFPLDSEQHVRSAIRLFGHAPEDKKKILARRIRSAANRYNIDIPDTTQVYKYLHEDDNILPSIPGTQYILVRNVDDELNKVDISNFRDIYLSRYKLLDNNISYPSINTAVDDNSKLDNAYIFTKNNSLIDNPNINIRPRMILLGIVSINRDDDNNHGWKWIKQETLLSDSRGLLYNTSNDSNRLEEFGLNAINPIVGMNTKMHYLISTSHPRYEYIYTQDPSAEKGLVINPKNMLEVMYIPKDLEFNNVYRFIGNESYIRQLERLYNKYAILPENMNLYTLLSGHELISENQIDQDTNNFYKLDFGLLEQKLITEMATFRDEVINLSNNRKIYMPVLDAFISVDKPEYFDKYNRLGDIKIKEDFFGYYYYSDLTHKRCQSMPTIQMLTENMLKSIL